MYRRWPLAALAAALTLMTAPAAFGAGSDPPAAAGWHGREIRDPLPAARPRCRRAVPARLVGGQRRPGQRLRQPERLAARARGAAPVGAPRLPARPDRRPLRRAHPRRRAVVSDQARPAPHGPRRRPQRRDPAPAPRARRTPATVDAPSPPSAARGSGTVRHPRARRHSSAPTGRGSCCWRSTDLLGLAAIVWWMRAEWRARRARPAILSDREPRAQLTAVTPPPAPALGRRHRLHRGRARHGSRARTRHRRADHRLLVREPRLAAHPESSTTSSRPAVASPSGPAWPTRSTRSPPVTSPASSSPTSATSPARSPSSPNSCNGSTKPRPS